MKKQSGCKLCYKYLFFQSKKFCSIIDFLIKTCVNFCEIEIHFFDMTSRILNDYRNKISAKLDYTII